MTPLIGIAEAARLLGVSKMTVRRLVHECGLPCIRLRKNEGPMQFDLRDIEKFVEQHKE